MKETRIATAMAQGSAEVVSAELIHQLREQLEGREPVLLAVFASTAQPLLTMSEKLATAFPKATLVGSSTAGEFTEKGDAKKATAVFALAGDYRVFAGIGTGLKADPERAVNGAIEGLPQALGGYPHMTALLLLDPLAGASEEATLLAASLLPPGVPLAGGAAGDDLNMKSTLVSCGTRVATDAVVVATIFSKAPLGLGVSHGHEPMSVPLRITRAEGNVVHEIEGRKAWDVWREQTRAQASRVGIDVDGLAPDGETPFLLLFEAGLSSGSAYKIRAPLSRDSDGSISFACGIPEGSVIRITESVSERQVASARDAARRARQRLQGAEPAGALVFDCVCRNLILGDAFADAVRGMSEELGGVRLAGFETYGEIALDAGDMSGFHNTTSVVLAFPGKRS